MRFVTIVEEMNEAQVGHAQILDGFSVRSHNHDGILVSNCPHEKRLGGI